ncbi:MAG: right-handed parallel beta-helix repeat-containing protein [Candidatus Marinimicrobia bacterium]|nr:right-handed parallel beta-helix repeat-containing protein [Candidatus Neomarinimicrobiota bacterium]
MIDPANTVVDADYDGRSLTLMASTASSDITVSGITIQNGNTLKRGGGARIETGGLVRLISNRIISNIADTYDGGGGAFIAGRSQISDNLISNNSTKSNGGGLSIWGDSFIENNDIKNNTASHGFGGGISIHGFTEVTLENNTVIENTALTGGGVYSDNNSTITLSENIISNNSTYNKATSTGGGGICTNGSASFIRNTITNNDSLHASAVRMGGCVYADTKKDRLFTFRGNVITGNTKVSIYLSDTTYGNNSGSLIFINNLLTGPTMEGELTPSTSALSISNGIKSAQIINNTILNYTFAIGASFQNNNSEIVIYNNIINAYSRSVSILNDGNDDYIGSHVTLGNNSFSLGLDSVSIDIETKITEVTDTNYFKIDAVFIDESNGDYHLSNISPLIDQGNNSAPNLTDFDIEHNPRIMGSSVDIGAYEFQGDASVVDAWNPLTNQYARYLDVDIPTGWLASLPIERDLSSLPTTVTWTEVNDAAYADNCEYTFYPDGTRYSLCGYIEGFAKWSLGSDSKTLMITTGSAVIKSYLLEESTTAAKVVAVKPDDTYSIIVMSKVDSSQYTADADNDLVPDVLDAFPVDALYSQDADADSLPDEWETGRIGNLTSSASSDNDGDGFTSIQEFTAGTDPLVVTVQSGFTQTDIDAAVSNAVSVKELACHSDPASCGIDVASVMDSTDNILYGFYELKDITVAYDNGAAFHSSDLSSIEGLLALDDEVLIAGASVSGSGSALIGSYTLSGEDLTIYSASGNAYTGTLVQNDSGDIVSYIDFSSTQGYKQTATWTKVKDVVIDQVNAVYTDYNLSAGWNLIGGNNADDMGGIKSFVDEHNASSVWHWDGGWKSFSSDVPMFLNNLIKMEANKGYYVNVPAQ